MSGTDVISKRGTLSRQNIIQTAAAMVDRDGADAFSMRRLGAEIGVDPMAVYHYIPNRAALLRELVRLFLDALDVPGPKLIWQDWVRAFSQNFRSTAKRHPGLFRVFSQSGDWSAEYLAVEEALHATLAEAVFSPQQRVRAGRLVMAYTENFVLWELSGSIASNDADERAQFIGLIESRDLPQVAALSEHILNVDADDEFAFGLDVTIRGLEAMLCPLATRADSPSNHS